jgi:proteasome lid subunit RPN8/RPN11
LARDSSGNLIGHVSIWFRSTPSRNETRAKVGFIGHYFALSSQAGIALLNHACRSLKNRGCDLAVGPVDGNTWRRYRFVTKSAPVAKFFLEPENPPEYPLHFLEAGFNVAATYASSMLPVKPEFLQSDSAGSSHSTSSTIIIRSIDPDRFHSELRKLYGIALSAFQNNYLYTPIDEEEFVSRYTRLKPIINKDLVLLAEVGGEPSGFVLALPDVLDATGKTAIIKTLARKRGASLKGLGLLLTNEVHLRAHELGFKNMIHALYKDDNASSAFSTTDDAQIIRKYSVFEKALTQSG